MLITIGHPSCASISTTSCREARFLAGFGLVAQLLFAGASWSWIASERRRQEPSCRLRSGSSMGGGS